MKQIAIGDQNGKAIGIDLLKLIDTRLLVQANSGGGKSWVLRLLAERAGDKLQTIILDNEGEFATLREQLDMVLVSGSDGEVMANPRSAGLLARRLIETQVSAVIDLYDLKLPMRREFVKLFLESLIHLPRELWRPTLVIIDEAHLYCPERGSGEAESTDAVIALMSQGRKRGYCGVLATQRLSKLHKDAAAECNNVLIGRTSLDNDQVRAGDILGMGKTERLELRNLGEGEWYGFGPAFSDRGVFRFHAGQVQTTHPKPGQRHALTAPAPSAKVRAMLAKLADIPQAAEAEIRDMKAAKVRIAQLERDVRLAAAGDRQDYPTAHAYEKACEALSRTKEQNVALGTANRELRLRLDRVGKMFARAFKVNEEIAGELLKDAPKLPEIPTFEVITPARPVAKRAEDIPTPIPRRNLNEGNGADKVGGGSIRRLLTALAQHLEGLSYRKLGVFSGVSTKGGSFRTYLSSMRGNGWIVGDDKSKVTITDAGLDALGDYKALPVGRDLLDYWIKQFGESKPAHILHALGEAWPNSLTDEEISVKANVSTAGGSYRTYLSKLRSRDLLVDIGRGQRKLSDEVGG